MDKLLVILGGIVLIGIIAWWFFGKKKLPGVLAEQSAEYQTVLITVEGGYKPNLVTLKAGKPAKITFMRKDSSSCLEEVILPDFGLSEKLPVNQKHEVTIKPDKPGLYTYTCGMRMFSGQIEVK